MAVSVAVFAVATNRSPGGFRRLALPQPHSRSAWNASCWCLPCLRERYRGEPPRLPNLPSLRAKRKRRQGTWYPPSSLTLNFNRAEKGESDG